MNAFIYETNLEHYYQELDIDVYRFKQQRMLYALVFAFLGLFLSGVLVFLLGKAMFVIGIFVTLFSGFIGYKWMYLQLQSAFFRHKKELDMLFPEFLTTFISLLNSQSNSNVINAVEGTIPYMKEPIKSQLISLVRSIYDDASVENAYDSFDILSKSIDNQEFEQILSLILDMYISGVNKDILADLESEIRSIKENKIKAFAKWKNGRMKNKASIFSMGMAVFYIFIWIGIVAAHYLKAGMSGVNM